MGQIISLIKKFINSDLTKPLNTIIDEVKSTLALIKAKTDLITTNLFTSTHATRIDANISSRQANAGFTTTHSARIDAAISTRADQATVDAIKAKTDTFVSGGIKSIQRGVAQISTGGFVRVTINAVNMSKSTINLVGSYTHSTNSKASQVLIKFINNTTLEFNNTDADGITYISWEVIEYY